MRILFSLLSLCMSMVTLQGQQLIGGTVINDRTGRSVEDVSVSLLDSKQSIIEYAFTDKKGAFSVGLPPSGRFVSFACLGYEPLLIEVQTLKNGLEIRLKDKEYQIREVKVVSERIRQRNDTLLFAVSGFRMKQDRSIADVIKKMPGLEVLPSGQIKFEDKAIGKLYIEGMDLMGGRYALATNNLSGKVVKEVQVLRNHQPVNALRGKVFTQQAAINLVLEDAVRYTFSGTTDAGTGYSADQEMLWDVRLLGMLFGRKQQNLTLYKTNNVGQNVEDEIRLQFIDRDLRVDGDEPLIAVPGFSVPQIEEKRYLDNQSHLFATNHLYQFTKETTLRGQFTLLSLNSAMPQESISSYFYPEGTVSIVEEQQTSLHANRYGTEVDFQQNGAKRYLHNRLEGSIDNDRGGYEWLTNGNSVYSNNRFKRKNLTNYFQLIHTYGARHVFKLQSVNAVRDLPQYLTVSPGLYQELLNGGEAYDAFSQKVRLRSFRSHTAAELQLKVANFYVNMQTGFDYSLQQLNSRLDCVIDDSYHPTPNQQFENDLRFTDAKVYATPSLRYKDEKWNAVLRVPFSYHAYQINHRLQEQYSRTYPRFFVEPSLFLSHQLNAFWELSNTLRYDYQVPDINQFYAHYVFTNYRTAFSGSGFYHYNQLLYSLRLNFNNPLNGLSWSLTGTATPSWKNKIRSTKQEGVLTSSEMVDMKYRDLSWSLRSRASKTFGTWKLFTALTADYGETRNRSLLSGEVVPYTSRNLWLGFDLSMQPSRYFTVEASQQYLYSSLGSRLTRGVSSEHFRTNASIHIFPTDHWKIKWHNAWVLGTKPLSSSVFFMDVAVSYLFMRCEVELAANNLLNNRSFEQTLFSSMSESTMRNHFRPREVVVKFRIGF